MCGVSSADMCHKEKQGKERVWGREGKGYFVQVVVDGCAEFCRHREHVLSWECAQLVRGKKNKETNMAGGAKEELRNEGRKVNHDWADHARPWPF